MQGSERLCGIRRSGAEICQRTAPVRGGGTCHYRVYPERNPERVSGEEPGGGEDYSRRTGKLLTDSGELDLDFPVSKFSPSSSVNGEMRKKWVILDGARYLLKVSQEHYGQQTVNEAIAGKLHELTGWKNYIPYRIDKAVIEGKNYPCSLLPLFTSQELEFLPVPIQTGILIILAFYMMKSSTDLCLWRQYLIQGTPCFIMKRRYRQKRIF